MNKLQINNLTMLQFPLMRADCNISHFITTRLGGMSKHTYSQFNTGAYCGDDPEMVVRNRMLLCDAMDVDPEKLFVPLQVHGDKLLDLKESFLNLSQKEKQNQLNGVDALVTSLPGVCIGITTADCVPVLLYAPDKQVVAAVHAGWRGTVLRIVEKTLQYMVDDYQCDPRLIKAGIGPSISLESFEVGEEVVEEFRLAGFSIEEIGYRNEKTGKMHLDLWKANQIQLVDKGVQTGNIEIAGLCTFSHDELFFSARRLGIHSGRMLSAIQLRSRIL